MIDRKKWLCKSAAFRASFRLFDWASREQNDGLHGLDSELAMVSASRKPYSVAGVDFTPSKAGHPRAVLPTTEGGRCGDCHTNRGGPATSPSHRAIWRW